MGELPAEPNATVRDLWADVGSGIEANQTVVWNSAVNSLKMAHVYLLSSQAARDFTEKYMQSIIGILVDQQAHKIGMHERSCVQDSLLFAVSIVAQDLEHSSSSSTQLLPTLELILDKTKIFFRPAPPKPGWNAPPQGVPEARINAIERFHKIRGFQLLIKCFESMPATELPQRLSLLHHVIVVLTETLPEETLPLAETIMRLIRSASEDVFKKMAPDALAEIQSDLRQLFDRLLWYTKHPNPNYQRYRTASQGFYQYWRDVVWTLISSKSLPLQLFGWEQVSELISACVAHRPPPKYYIVKGGGAEIVNGRYDYSGATAKAINEQTNQEGCVVPLGTEILYARKVTVPNKMSSTGINNPLAPTTDTIVKTLTIFRCTMRSQQKWWFLSEADEEQPGTDRDIDYYQHKSRPSEEGQPPCGEWITCKNAGQDPPPTMEPFELMVPPGEEYNTLEHQLAKWAIENRIVEQVLGDTTIHREVVARSTVLVKFLASMCDRYPAEVTPKYCLQTSHLLFAWKTCLRKADAAVSSQVYQLLVSILPLCPVDLANPLLLAVQTSLKETDDKKDHLFEVSEFCASLASGNLVDVKGIADSVPSLKEPVREEVLNLLWSVLTHRNASSLRSYNSLKQYVSHELRVEPKGKEHREKLIRKCFAALKESASTKDKPFDEVEALRMADLTHFVLEACPGVQAAEIVLQQDKALPMLIFNELTAYLTRRTIEGHGFIKKTSTTQLAAAEEEARLHAQALNGRLHILRYVYGVVDPKIYPNDPVVISAEMLQSLWELCETADDREALMVFIARAVDSPSVSRYELGPNQTQRMNIAVQQLTPAFTQDVAFHVFLNLFCAPILKYDYLGDSAYRSFKHLFSSTRFIPKAGDEEKTKAAMDALWRICLTVKDDDVAGQAMRDLLHVYITASNSAAENGQPSLYETMIMTDKNESFRERLFRCLTIVKQDLESGLSTASRSVERCLWILNAAIGQSKYGGHSVSSSTLLRLASLDENASLDDVVKNVPHGLRGQASYRRVGISVKRTQQIQAQNQGIEYTPKSAAVGKFSLDLHPLETLASVKRKVASYYQCSVASVKPVQVNGRASRRNGVDGQNNHLAVNMAPEETAVDELGIVEGCEFVFVITEPQQQTNIPLIAPAGLRAARTADLSDFFFDDGGGFSDSLFNVLMSILKLVPWNEGDEMTDTESDESLSPDAYQLVWEFLLAAPTNKPTAAYVQMAASAYGNDSCLVSSEDPMEVEAGGEGWEQLLELKDFDRSVYVLLTIDAMMKPAQEVLSILPSNQQENLSMRMTSHALEFLNAFVSAGGFQHVVRFFSSAGSAEKSLRSKTRRGNAVALRILKTCLFGDAGSSDIGSDDTMPNESGLKLLDSVSDARGLLMSLSAMVVDDPGISSSSITDVLRFLGLLFQSPTSSENFEMLPGGTWESFLIKSLTHEDDPSKIQTNSSISAAMHVRKSARDLILQTTKLADSALPWLTKAIASIDVGSDSTEECFDVVEKIVNGSRANDATCPTRPASDEELYELSSVVCKKLAACPRPESESEAVDVSTGALCGCLKLLRAIVESGRRDVLRQGVVDLLETTGCTRWSEGASVTGDAAPLVAGRAVEESDAVFVNLMGIVFDNFLTPSGVSSVAVCCDTDSRRMAFEVIGAAASACSDESGYMVLVSRVKGLITSAAPNIKYRWGQFGAGKGETNTRSRTSSKYSGLRNAGCTCYMNSVLQQLFMMAELRDSLCSVPLPSSLRSSGDASSKGAALVGKRISLQWENGVSYDAVVESFGNGTGKHIIRYCPVNVAAAGTQGLNKIDSDVISRLSANLPDEFILTEGRPGKETGAYEIVVETAEMETDNNTGHDTSLAPHGKLQETEDERASRRLLEEVQRTFIHLDEGSRGRHFDPRALVEACACLKLEFDVWQQNDASEFTTKLLDRLEISLKKWAPSHFQYLDHTFGIQQTKQKICRECGLKTNREEKLLNIDCQIRGKADIHEALATFTETEIMEGSNKVYCETCEKNTDTVLRTAISTLPNILILSLKRFDLDFTTFETVKLNSRCAFGQTLNMKDYTLEGLEAKERSNAEGASPMDTEDGSERNDASLQDDDYEYRLAGVLVHAGVAQGGHYYSFIKERDAGSEEKWFRFDDEDVTPFDPANIETECFGGRVKKETKWPNGQMHTVEQEQFANALMLFYEKVKVTETPPNKPAEAKEDPTANGSPAEIPQSLIYERATGYDVYKSDVRRSNASHRWQAFLFDSEFQLFMKNLLSLCSEPTESSHISSRSREPLILTLLDYFFDVMLYASDHGYMHEWVRMLEEALYNDAGSGRTFVHGLARKTSLVSSNWFRTYLMDCPEQAARAGSVRIFCAGILSCLRCQDERKALLEWTKAWEEQMKAVESDLPPVVPSVLQQKWALHEDIDRLETSTSSSVGILLSFLNVLFDAFPRCWRTYSEPYILVRNLANISVDNEFVIRPALLAAQMPARLIATTVRDRLLPHSLREAFFSASLSHDLANTQTRAESSHVMVVNQMHGNENGQRGSGPDFIFCLEALGSIASLPGIVNAPLAIETREMIRGRRRYMLTDAAMRALSVVFQENTSPGAPGMNNMDIHSYLSRCGLDGTQGAPQKTFDILKKYSSPDESQQAPRCLTLAGFVSYYRDTAQSNDLRLRSDLHVFGFRPDLSRRSLTSRMIQFNDRVILRETAESVAIDVAEVFGQSQVSFGSMADIAIQSTFSLFDFAFRFSETHALYLLAAISHLRVPSELINRILCIIYDTPGDWQSNERVPLMTMALEVIAAVPDSNQSAKIALIMESNCRPRDKEFSMGLLPVLRALHQAQQGHSYSQIHWIYARYIEILKSLRKYPSVRLWMQANEACWSFIEKELTEICAPDPQHHSHHIQDEYSGRDDSAPIYGPVHSSNVMLNRPEIDISHMDDESEDDDDSRFGEQLLGGQAMNIDPGTPINQAPFPNQGPIEIHIRNCGSFEVNGVYLQCGYFGPACRYSKTGLFGGKMETLFIFQCNVSNNTRHWYISIVPIGKSPGTSTDIDFYTAPVSEESDMVPPRSGWTRAQAGRDPAPYLDYQFGSLDDDEEEEDDEDDDDDLIAYSGNGESTDQEDATGSPYP